MAGTSNPHPGGTTSTATKTTATKTPAEDGFSAPTVYAQKTNGGSGHLDYADPDD